LEKHGHTVSPYDTALHEHNVRERPDWRRTSPDGPGKASWPRRIPIRRRQWSSPCLKTWAMLRPICSIRENARQTPCYIWSGCCRLCRCAQLVLGAPEGSFQRSWREDVEPWLVSPDRK